MNKGFTRMKLTDTKVKSVKPTDKTQKLADGNGLSLHVLSTGAKVWYFRFRNNGAETMLSLGKYPQVSIKEARAECERMKSLKAQGINPSIEKKIAKLAQAHAIKNDFESVARAWFENWHGNKSKGHVTRVLKMIERDILPVMGAHPVQSITAPLVRLAVKQVASRGAYDVANDVFTYIRLILTSAVNNGLATSNITTDMSIKDLMPVRTVQHHLRVDEKDLPQLLKDIDKYDGNAITKIAVKLLSLTFVRTSELIGAEWQEIDFIAKVWRIPAHRMKKKTQHTVPLSKQSLFLLNELKTITGGNQYLFPCIKGEGKTMSNNTILFALYRMGYRGRMTGHGFRGVASTLLNEQGFRGDLVELQLAHLRGNAVERAYNAMQLIPERTAMMQAWADYLDAQRGIGQVLKMKQA